MASPRVCDVFLSFRGQDTSHSFTDHLYDALDRAGIGTFRDNEEIESGEELQPEIKRAITEARASVVLFSEKYATSTRCLDELTLILQQRREFNHFVLPVFYRVDPSDMRKQRKTFAIEVKASSRWTHENVKLWKKTLNEVATLTGIVLLGSEMKFLKNIVGIIYDKLNDKEFSLPINMIGMATRYGEISSWLNHPNVEFLLIYGMGGIGKTTLAKYIYNSNWKIYENMCFVEGIGRICEGPNGLLVAQEKLLQGIVGGIKRKGPSFYEGKCQIEEALQIKRHFIVLDDIAEYSQLVEILGTGKINARTKIIITTRYNATDSWFRFTDWRCQEYKMELLNDDESLELLSRHAFGSKVPMEGYEELADEAVRYCEGHPLALEVLASSLSKNNTILDWKSQLNALGNNMHPGIQSVVMMSYNSLPFDSEKELFLHIACFFVGKDVDYVAKILEHDYCASSGIKSLSNRCLLSVSPNKKLMMHRLHQEMGKNIVRQESRYPEKRSRVWLSSDSYKILSKGKGSKSMQGLALDMQLLKDQMLPFKSSKLKTDALQKMYNLKLLQLNFVQLTGSYENFPKDLRWLCWHGSNLRTIPSDLFMGKLVALDMSYSNLEVFEPPMVLESLQILNLTDSHNLFEIRNIYMIPHLETLILWNCHSLARVCETIGDLTSLTLLNMTGCISLCKSQQTELSLEASTTSGGKVAQQPAFSFPCSLHRLFLKDCNLDCTNSFSLSFNNQPSLQYLNLGNSLFEFLPSYDHLKSLRVLDLTLCSRLKQLLCLPSTLAELYISYCRSLEEISFQSHRFTLQEFGYEGCVSLLEIEGFIKLVPVAKLEENDLGGMKWLKQYENHEVCLVGDDELTKGRSSCVQMLYEFNIMSTSLPNMEDPNMKPTYVSSELSSLSFDVPSPPKNRRLKGINVTFKYTTVSGDDDMVWFCKINTSSGVDLTYNPLVFGKPESGEVGIWLSYWPIGSTLGTGDEVGVSIAVISGLEVHEFGVSLVYNDDEVDKETVEDNITLVEPLGGDLSGFQLTTKAYYLCRRDFFESMEVGRLSPGWFSILDGDTIDWTEVRGWRKTGRPTQLNSSMKELYEIQESTISPHGVTGEMEVEPQEPAMPLNRLLSESIFELSEMVINVAQTTDTIKPELELLRDTCKRITPIIWEIVYSNRQLDHTEAECNMFILEIQEATKLFGTCLKVKWNVIKKYTYSQNLKYVNSKLLRFFQIDVQAFQSPGIKETRVNDVEFGMESLSVFRKDMLQSKSWTGNYSDSMSTSTRTEQERCENLERKIYGWRAPALPSGVVAFEEPLKKLKAEVVAGISSSMRYYGRSVLVVAGASGCGKTTLVKMLCHDPEIRENFGENIFFVTVSETPNLMVMVDDLFNPSFSGLHVLLQSNDDAKNKLENFLSQKVSVPMLIVLDDVCSDSFIDNFPSKNRGCTILVTSRTAFTKYNVFRLDPLNDKDANAVFCRFAFNEGRRRPTPTINDKLVNQMARCCRNHPLTLSVVGRSLNGKDESVWESMLKSLSQYRTVRDSPKDVFIGLEKSFEALDDESKQCFLDFGLFPQHQRIAVSALLIMWVHLYNHDDDGVDTLAKIFELSHRNLVNLMTTENDLGAPITYCDQQFVTQHDLLRELAIYLNSKQPVAQRRRLIINAQGQDLPASILQVQEPMQACILSISSGESFSSQWCNLEAPDVEVLVLNFMSKTYSLPLFLAGMQKLKILNVTNHGFYHMEIENFHLLGHSYSLTRISLEGVAISTSILSLVNLQKVSFKMCKIGSAFKKLGSNTLPRLLALEIDYCQDLVEFPEILCTSLHLKKLSITNCIQMSELSEEIANLTSLGTLCLHSCIKLKKLPESISRLEKLSILDISDCLSLSKLPNQIGKLGGLRVIYMQGCVGLTNRLPPSVKDLSKTYVVCNEEISYQWRDFRNVKIHLV